MNKQDLELALEQNNQERLEALKANSLLRLIELASVRNMLLEALLELYKQEAA